MRGRLALLVLLAGWSVLLSLESWVRPPGDPQGLRPPDRILRQGRAYVRLAPYEPGAPAPPAALPEGVTLLEVARYRPQAAPQGAAGEIRLLHLALTRSGRSGVMPVEAISRALSGSADGGRCIVPDAEGGIAREFFTAQQWRAARDRQRLSWPHRLAWLAGLRPFRDNSCLWEGSSAP